MLVDVVDRVKTRLVEEEYAPQVRRHPDDLLESLKRAQNQIDDVEDLADAGGSGRGGTRRPVDRAGLHRLAQHGAGRRPPHLGGRAVRRRRCPRQPLRVELPRGGGRPAPPSDRRRARGRPSSARCSRSAPTSAACCTPNATCARTTARAGIGSSDAVVAYVMLDYSALGFISSQSPYYEFFRVPRTTREGTSGRRRRADGVRLGPAADLHLAQPIVAADRRRLRHRLPIAGRVLDDAGARRRRRSRLRLEQSPRHLRRRLSDPDAFTHLVNLGELTAFAGLLFVLLLASTSLLRAVVGRSASPLRMVVQEIRVQLLPQAVPRLRRRHAGAGAGPGAARPRLRRQPAARRRGSRRRPDGAHRQARHRGIAGAAAARAGRRHRRRPQRRRHGVDQPHHRSGREHLRRHVDAAGHERTRPVRVGAAADADAGPGPPCRRHRSPADLRRPGSHRRLRLPGGGGAGPHRRPRPDPHRAARAAPARDRARDRRPRSRGAARRADADPARRRPRLLDGRADRRSGAAPDPRDAPHRRRRPQHARHRPHRRRAAAPGRGLQPDGRRAAAAAQPGRADAPPRGLGRDGAPGRPRHQEPADADPALGRAPAAGPPRSRPAAVAGPRHLRRHDPHAGAAAPADRLRVLQLRVVADRAADARRRSPTCCTRSSIRTSSASATGSRSRSTSPPTCRR